LAFSDLVLRLLAEVVFFSVAAESAAGGVAAAVESGVALFFVLLLVVFFLAVAESASGVVALAVESAFVLFFVLVFAAEVALSASAAPAGFFVDLLAVVEDLAAVPVSAVAESVFFLVVVFFEVVDLSVVLGVAVESVESAAGFFFLVFFLAVESVWV
jgi:hypothetical protein